MMTMDTPLSPNAQSRGNIAPNIIAIWLWTVAALVFAMVVIGGITRLTESGLSITEWLPVTGTLPPMSDAAWAEAFEKYKTIPEYTEINGPAGMTLESFKFIFFWEWAHRLMGRVVGLALLLPWLVFAGAAVLRMAFPAKFSQVAVLPSGYLLRIFSLGMLVALQGAIGWWMVASGLSERTDVSHFRLSVHLLTALFILSGLVWTALDLRALTKNSAASSAKVTAFSAGVLAILFIQLLFGAWVAGMNAGQVSNTWPLMNDRFFPEGINWGSGIFSALANDPFLVHFVHRWWAWAAVAALIWMAITLKHIGARPPSIAIHASLGIQIVLGIATVMSGVNISLAVLHQAVGALLVASTIWGAHCLGSQTSNSAYDF
jgi:heme a synthase